jgi:hypothetical protein
VLRLVEVADQEEAPDFEVPRMRSVHPVAMRFERDARPVQHRRWPTQIARHQRDLGFSNNASRPRDGLFRTKRACGSSQERLGLDEIAELCHRDAAKRKRWRIVAQRNALERAEWITCRECTCRRRDQ